MPGRRLRLTENDAAELVAEYGARVTDLMKRFGLCRRAVHDYLERSGVERRANGRSRAFDHLAEAMAADYQAGMSMTEIGAKHGNSKETVRRALDDLGVERRPAARRVRVRRT